jgi:IS30 family transposase
MVRSRMSEATRWQIIGMHNAGMSSRGIGRQLDRDNTVASRLVAKHGQTNDVKDMPRPGRPRTTTEREDRALLRLVRCNRFMSSTFLRTNWIPNRAISRRTIRYLLKGPGNQARSIKDLF